ncbi:hypothetical protein [Hyalangium gracile]|uniref:hypothetical protein n=1 Tax=Hyalangium gracile TaxID=394092 RepID=UPI001CC9A8C6|nr:hypothetical protein [Hyalangium gracile]
MKMKLLSAVLLSAALVAGCGDDEESVDADACEHLQEGPSSSLTASTDNTGAPAVSNDHRRYDIALIDAVSGKGGIVSFAVSEAADYTVYLNGAVPVTVKTANGQTIEPEVSGTGSSECDEIKRRHTFALQVGTHTLSFGPTTETSVGLVIVEANHEHDHED